MAELLRTNDFSLVSVVEGLLREAEIPYQVADRNMSVLEGSVLAIQQRVLVPDEHEAEAHQILVDADLGHWLRRKAAPDARQQRASTASTTGRTRSTCVATLPRSRFRAAKTPVRPCPEPSRRA